MKMSQSKAKQNISTTVEIGSISTTKLTMYVCSISIHEAPADFKNLKTHSPLVNGGASTAELCETSELEEAAEGPSLGKSVRWEQLIRCGKKRLKSE